MRHQYAGSGTSPNQPRPGVGPAHAQHAAHEVCFSYRRRVRALRSRAAAGSRTCTARIADAPTPSSPAAQSGWRDARQRSTAPNVNIVSLGRFCAKIYNETRAKPDAYFSEMLGDDDNGAMRAITRDYVFTKPFQEDETNRKIDAAS